MKASLFLRLFLLTGTFLFLFSSCSSERKIANSYIYGTSKQPILLETTDYVFKKGYIIPAVPDFNKLSAEQKEQILLDSSMMLNKIEDSLFIVSFKTGIENSLARNGVRVISGQSRDEFRKSFPNGLIINLEQIQVEEFLISTHDTSWFGETYLPYPEYDLLSLNINTWFEVNDPLDTEKPFRVLWATNNISDIVKENVYYDNGSQSYVSNFEVTYLNEDVYLTQTGMRGYYTGSRLFDYFLNKYIRRETKNPSSSVWYMFNSRSGYLSQTTDPFFQELPAE